MGIDHELMAVTWCGLTETLYPQEHVAGHGIIPESSQISCIILQDQIT